MGMSDPEFYLSREKDFTVSTSFQPTSMDQFQVQEEVKKFDGILVSAALEIKLPSLDGEFKTNDYDEEDGICRTPTSMDHKLPLIFSCPPAPRKPKSFTRKRKTGAAPPCCPRRILISDLSTEIEGLFAPAVAFEDLEGIIKKVKNF